MRFHFACLVCILVLLAACSDDRPMRDGGGADGAIDCSTVGCAPPPPPGEACTAPCGCCSGPTDGGPNDAPAPTDAGSLECGTMTCGAGEYCLVVCTCCGTPTPDGGPGPSADYSCEPIPAACTDVCTCESLSTPCGRGTCTGPRQVSCPCA